MQVAQLVSKVVEEMFPQAIERLKYCKTNQEAALWRRDILSELNMCMLEGEQPQEEESKESRQKEYVLLTKVRKFLEEGSKVEVKKQNEIEQLKL